MPTSDIDHFLALIDSGQFEDVSDPSSDSTLKQKEIFSLFPEVKKDYARQKSKIAREKKKREKEDLISNVQALEKSNLDLKRKVNDLEKELFTLQTQFNNGNGKLSEDLLKNKMLKSEVVNKRKVVQKLPCL